MTEQPTTSYPGFGNYGPTGRPGRPTPARPGVRWPGTAAPTSACCSCASASAVWSSRTARRRCSGCGAARVSRGSPRTWRAFGYQQATTLSWVTGVTELVAGAFLVLGLLTPLAAAAVLAIMINAVLLKLGNGFFVTGPKGSDAIEFSLLARARRRVPGVHRARADRVRQRPRLAPAPRVVGRARARHRRRRRRARLRPAAAAGGRLTADDRRSRERGSARTSGTDPGDRRGMGCPTTSWRRRLRRARHFRAVARAPR